MTTKLTIGRVQTLEDAQRQLLDLRDRVERALNDLSFLTLADVPATFPPSAHVHLLPGDVSAIEDGQSVDADVTTGTPSTTSVSTGLTKAIGANETWWYFGWLKVSCSGTGGVNVVTSATPAGAFVSLLLFGNGASSTSFQFRSTLTPTVSPGAWAVVGSTDLMVMFALYVKTAGTAGTIDLRFASQTAGQVSTVKQGSIMLAQRVA